MFIFKFIIVQTLVFAAIVIVLKKLIFTDTHSAINRLSSAKDRAEKREKAINDKAAKRILLKNGFIKIPGTVFFGFHCSNNSLILSANLEDWFITRGDADAAGSLAPNS